MKKLTKKLLALTAALTLALSLTSVTAFAKTEVALISGDLKGTNKVSKNFKVTNAGQLAVTIEGLSGSQQGTQAAPVEVYIDGYFAMKTDGYSDTGLTKVIWNLKTLGTHTITIKNCGVWSAFAVGIYVLGS